MPVKGDISAIASLAGKLMSKWRWPLLVHHAFLREANEWNNSKTPNALLNRGPWVKSANTPGGVEGVAVKNKLIKAGKI